MRLSTRDDARLTAEERAALSSLEALAAADDPQLAARLRGPRRLSAAVQRSRTRVLIALGRVPAGIYSLWAAVPVVALGLLLVVLGLSLGWGVGVAGALLAATGLGSIAREAGRRLGSGGGH